jgi:hypothetical protein
LPADNVFRSIFFSIRVSVTYILRSFPRSQDIRLHNLQTTCRSYFALLYLLDFKIVLYLQFTTLQIVNSWNLIRVFSTS